MLVRVQQVYDSQPTADGNSFCITDHVSTSDCTGTANNGDVYKVVEQTNIDYSNSITFAGDATGTTYQRTGLFKLVGKGPLANEMTHYSSLCSYTYNAATGEFHQTCDKNSVKFTCNA